MLTRPDQLFWVSLNIVTQDVCSLDLVDHLNAVYDDIALRIARNALDPAHPVPPFCHLVLPLL